MNQSSTVLSEYITSSSVFLTLGEDKEIQVKFLDVEPSSLMLEDGTEVPCVQYYFEYKGKTKIFRSSSVGLARKLDEVPKGAEIIIKRTGKGYKTRFFITLVKSESNEPK